MEENDGKMDVGCEKEGWTERRNKEIDEGSRREKWKKTEEE